MENKINIQGYLATATAPWGKLFYKMVWEKINCDNKQILDFGSGFGFTANHFAATNQVTAIEPNKEMLKYRISENKYNQIQGDIHNLIELPNESFDLIICHNVFEYLDNRIEILKEFHRLLKPDGVLSIVKHNKLGKIMQKAILEYKIEEALTLINQGEAKSVNFGVIKEYDDLELEKYGEDLFTIQNIYGVRTFFALQRNELKIGDEWIHNMFKLELAVEEKKEFRDIAFFHHLILKKKKTEGSEYE